MLYRALDEMQHACQAASDAAREAEASNAAGAAALQEQQWQVRQLQLQIDTLKQQHRMELQAMQQSTREQVGCGTHYPCVMVGKFVVHYHNLHQWPRLRRTLSTGPFTGFQHCRCSSTTFLSALVSQ